jgi:hypothetical protein
MGDIRNGKCASIAWTEPRDLRGPICLLNSQLNYCEPSVSFA